MSTYADIRRVTDLPKESPNDGGFRVIHLTCADGKITTFDAIFDALNAGKLLVYNALVNNVAFFCYVTKAYYDNEKQKYIVETSNNSIKFNSTTSDEQMELVE